MPRVEVFLTAALIVSVAGVGKADTPDPDAVSLERVDYSGSGCPEGSAFGFISPDRQAFTLAFSSFIAEMGPNTSPQEKRKNCDITVGLDFPEGWQYTVFRVDYRGFALLEDGTWGRQHAIFRFRGGLLQRPSHIRLTGPYSDDYVRSDTVGLSNQGWSPCGPQAKELDIKTWIHVGGRARSRALLTLDSIDGAVQQTYRVAWRRCS